MPPRAIRAAEPAARPPGLPEYWPTTDWKTAEPEQAGVDTARLEQALTFSTPFSATRGIVVVRHGYIVGERYFAGASAEQRFESYSMAKSFTSALVGIAIKRGLLPGTDARICDYYDEWLCEDATDPRSAITVDHVMNISSGLDWHEDWRTGAAGVNDVYLGGSALLDYVLRKPANAAPGSVLRYSTGDPALLSGVLQRATGKTAYAFARESLLDAIGLSGVSWASDNKGRTTTYAGIQATAREYAKLGYLYLRAGQWEGRELVPKSWIDQTTQPKDACADQYRYLWHVNAPLRLGEPDTACGEIIGCMPRVIADLPKQAFFAEGIFGQFIFVVPSADLVIARVAQDQAGSEHWDDYARALLDLLLDAVGQ